MEYTDTTYRAIPNDWIGIKLSTNPPNDRITVEINNAQTLAEVTLQFDRYQQAIIDNDIAVLNELFWNNTHTIRYGVGENLYSHGEIASFRGTRDPKSVARVVGKTVVTSYGRDTATTNIEFTRAGRNGRQSQTWVRMPEGWRIVSAHVSYKIN